MKIAFLTPEYPHSKTGNSGGIGTGIKNLAQALAERDLQPSVLIYGQQSDYFFQEDGIDFYGIKNVKLKGLSWFLTRKKIQKRINELYAEKKIDVVEAPDWTGITSFINVKCPIVIRENGSDTYFCHLDGRKVKFKNFFHERRALRKADSVIAVSQFTGDLTNQLFKLKRNFTVIPNSINSTHFNIVPKQNDNQRILYFGSLIRKKGLLELPLIFNQVVAMNPDAELMLIGKDVPDIMSGNASTWEMMRGLFSAEAFKKVSYIGPKSYDEVGSYIATAVVCVFPSFAEALPVSWLEAMSMGKAIVASDIGWANEMITDGQSGFLVHPNNHKLFAEKINILLQNRLILDTFGCAARQRIEDYFSTIVVVEKNIAFYKDVTHET
ncbi:glycosyltransferase family 4 protein [Flavobacterium sp.]|uniref:glycosyltransferase family 4 protein n=1 Tax=Flavobacterium sp. TaxID=239 RepID=UPI0026161CB8|nr:glycosyltransferase family 4 protein [Flavobacterium sp.]